jgi:hypothetical protein
MVHSDFWSYVQAGVSECGDWLRGCSWQGEVLIPNAETEKWVWRAAINIASFCIILWEQWFWWS